MGFEVARGGRIPSAGGPHWPPGPGGLGGRYGGMNRYTPDAGAYFGHGMLDQPIGPRARGLAAQSQYVYVQGIGLVLVPQTPYAVAGHLVW